MEENKHDFNNVFFQQASRLAKIGIWEFDIVNDKIYWSTMVHELHETNPKTFIPNLETALGLYRNDYQSIVNEIIVKSIETGAAFDFEAVIITKKRKNDGFGLLEMLK